MTHSHKQTYDLSYIIIFIGMEYNSGSGGDFQSPGGSQGGGARKATDEQTLIPVTIKMLLEAIPNNKILLDGREPYHVKLVAAVTTVNKTSTSYGYTVEDGTGSIEVKEWIDEGNLEISKMREEAAQDHQYVRIIGKLEEYDSKAKIVAVAVRKLSSGNELTHHLLEVVYEGEKFKKSGQIVGSPSAAMGNMSFGSNNMHSSEPITNNSASTGGGLESEVMAYLRNGEYNKHHVHMTNQNILSRFSVFL